MTAEWRLRRVGDGIDDDFERINWLTDAYNRFARGAEVVLDDPDSDVVSRYPRGRQVELEVSVPGFFDFRRRFAGFVADYQQDRNSTSLTILSHDFWIRKRTVNREFVDTRLEVILETLIDDLTPLTYNATLIDLQSNPEITREWRGEQLEVVLDEIGEISGGNEDYGATDDLDFFYRVREFESAPRDFSAGEYLNVEWNQDGKREVNRAIVEYGEGDSAGVQIREDASAQLDLQEQLNADDPVVIEERKAYPEITDPDGAADKAKQLLNDKSSLTTGEIETWEAFAVSPGQVTDVVDPDTGTDGEFIVAEITYRWPGESPETEVTVADKSVATSEELIALSDDITRVDLRDTDSNAPVEQNIPTKVGANIEPTATLGGVNHADIRLTNVARNLIRDGWRDDGTLDVAEIAVGTDGSNLSRTNELLEAETFRASASESLLGDTGVQYSAEVGDADTREIGLFDSAGNLLVRAVFAEGGVGVDVTLSVGNDPEPPLGVLTDTGQEAIRDIIADNAPVVPQFYAFGDGDADPTTGDIALQNEIAKQDLDEILIQQAQTTSDFSDLVGEIDDSTPLLVEDGALKLAQTAFGMEGEDGDGAQTAPSDGSGAVPDEWSDGAAAWFPDTDQVASYTFALDKPIPVGEVGVATRNTDGDGGTSGIEISLDGTVIEELSTGTGLVLGWNDHAQDSLGGSGFSGSLDAGEHTITIDCVAGGDGNQVFYADYVALYDARFTTAADWDNVVHEDGGYLDDPPLKPANQEREFATASTRRDVTEATFSLTANDTSNNFWVELANDGTNYTRVDNSATGSVSFAEPNTGVDARVNLSRFGGPRNATPRFNFEGQEISLWELFADPSALLRAGIGRSETRAVFPAGGDLSGQVLREAGQLGSGDELLSRSIFSDIPRTGTLPNTTTIISSEVTSQTQGLTPTVFDSGHVTAIGTPDAREVWAESGDVTATATPKATEAGFESASVTAVATPSAEETAVVANQAQAQMLAHVGHNYGVIERKAGVSSERARQLTNTYTKYR